MEIGGKRRSTFGDGSIGLSREGLGGDKEFWFGGKTRNGPAFVPKLRRQTGGKA